MAEPIETELESLYTFNTDTGTIDPADYDEVEAIVDADVREALGITTDVHPSTPLGRMLEWLSVCFTNVLGLNVQNANQLLLSAAAGQQLDAMAQWFQLERKAASYTRVNATVAGTPETIIPAGSRARNEEGYYFATPEAITIGSDGLGTGVFISVLPGPIPCGVGSLQYIDTPTTGWTSISNEEAGSIGSSIETDDALRNRIDAERTTAIGFLGAIKNAIEKVSGVHSSMVVENNTGAQLAVRGIPMEKHSIFVCVDGLDDDTIISEVAQAVFDNKPCGTAYTRFNNNGETATGGDKIVKEGNEVAVTVTDAYGNPYPVYMYKPEDCQIKVFVSVVRRKYAGSDLNADITNAINTWFTTTPPTIGETVYASDIMQSIEEYVPGIIVVDCKVSDGGAEAGVAYTEIAACQKAVFDSVVVKDETK